MSSKLYWSECANNLCLCSWIFNWPNMFTSRWAITLALLRCAYLRCRLHFINLGHMCTGTILWIITLLQRIYATLSVYIFVYHTCLLLFQFLEWFLFYTFCLFYSTHFYQLSRRSYLSVTFSECCFSAPYPMCEIFMSLIHSLEVAVNSSFFTHQHIQVNCLSKLYLAIQHKMVFPHN